MGGRPGPACTFPASLTRRDELLAVRFVLALGLREPLTIFLVGHGLTIAELRWPLERHAQLVVGREEARDVGIAPRRAWGLER